MDGWINPRNYFLTIAIYVITIRQRYRQTDGILLQYRV